MTVQELINKLEAIDNKGLQVYIPHCVAYGDHETIDEVWSVTIQESDPRDWCFDENTARPFVVLD